MATIIASSPACRSTTRWSTWRAGDLRKYGGATWFYTSWAVVTMGAGKWCEYEYADPNPGDTVRVLVIEIRSVIR